MCYHCRRLAGAIWGIPVKTLIAAELVNVAAGLIGAKRTIEAALATISAGAQVPQTVDLSNDTPRSMPFTSSLGAELLLLSVQEIDILSTLESNLSVTRREMQDVTMGRRSFGLLSATTLGKGIVHDMGILAKGFDVFAPSRKLMIDSQPPELAAALLRRLAHQEADHDNQPPIGEHSIGAS